MNTHSSLPPLCFCGCFCTIYVKREGDFFFLIGTIFRADLHKCIFFFKNKFSVKNIIRAPEERNMQVGKELIHSPFKLFGALFFISIILNE